jgi:hypothetical protein
VIISCLILLCNSSSLIKIRSIRFIESEIRFRFKKPLVDLGKNLNDISTCINALKDSRHITADVGIQLSSIINSLNTPMHEIGDDSIENTRALAKLILNVVYNDL